LIGASYGAALARPVAMTQARVALGKSGEDLACDELQRRGYAILARRYRRRRGELDIIARDGDTTVFVEVKTRRGRQFGGGGEAVHGLKRLRMTRLAIDYLARHGLTGRPCRFDVVTIDVASEQPAIEVFKNAFTLER
jgi:putative endonuclease